MGIRVTNLRKDYEDTTIVHNSTFTVEDGEFLTLLGPSGCGKTTTLRCVAGLERTNGGVIEIDGQVVSDPQRNIFVAPHERNLGMVFQSYAIWPHMTVAENVAFPLRIKGIRDTKEAVSWALDVVGLSAMADRQPSETSGGQQQRVALARAIVGKPKVLLFDEPLSNLDARLRDRTRAEISRIQKELSISAIYVTHDQAEALSMSDRIIVMDNGHVIEEGDPRTLYRRPNHRFTADFIGAANFLSVKHHDGAWFAPDGSEIRISEDPDRPQEGAVRDEVRELVLRSECLQLRGAGAGLEHGENALKGVVQSLQYMGSHIEYAVNVSGTVLNVLSPDEFETGTPVQVTFPAGHARLLPRPARTLAAA